MVVLIKVFSMRKTYASRRYRRRRPSNNGWGVVPFLVLVLVGLSIVLFFKLWGVLFASPEVKGAYVHIVEGAVSTKQWKADDFVNIRDDVLILSGDELKTSADSKVIVEFFDGTLMRLSGGTDLVFKEFVDDPDAPKVSLLLLSGDMWVNKFYKEAGSKFIVKVPNVEIISVGKDVFALSARSDDAIRGIKGAVNVSVYSEDGDDVVDDFSVGVGQEAIFSEKVLKAYWEHKSPSVLSPLSDEFKGLAWYKWNLKEDRSPTEFSKLAGGDALEEAPPEVLPDATVSATVTSASVSADGVTIDSTSEEEVVDTTDDVTVNDDSVNDAVVQKPTIVSVSGVTKPDADGFYVITTYVGVIKGSVVGASKVIVNDYTLSKFKQGDSSWTYFANAKYNLMKEGENTYNVYAVDDGGNKSESLIVKVRYNPPAPVSVPVVEDSSASTSEASTSDSEASASSEDTSGTSDAVL